VTGHFFLRRPRSLVVAITFAAGTALGIPAGAATAAAVTVDEPVQIGDAVAVERPEPARVTDGVAVAGITLVRADPIDASRIAPTIVYDETDVFPRVVIMLSAFSLVAALFWSRARASLRRAAVTAHR
jgi:hypothetical protein